MNSTANQVGRLFEVRRPFAELLVAVLLIGVQAAALGYFSRTIAFPTIITLVAIYAAVVPRRYTVNRTMGFRLVVALAFLFLAKYAVAPPYFRGGSLAVRTQLVHVIGQFLLTVQAGRMLVSQAAHRPPAQLPWLGIITMLCAADVVVQSNVERFGFQLLVVAFVLLAAMHMGLQRDMVSTQQHHNGRTIALGLSLLLIGVLSWFSAAALYQHERDLENLIAEFLDPPTNERRTGFSGTGELDSVTRRHAAGETQIALRVYADGSPGYLRGETFDSLTGRKWITAKNRQTRTVFGVDDIGHAEMQPADTRNRYFPVTRNSRTTFGELRRMEFWPGDASGDAFFTPLNSAWFAADADWIELSDTGIVDAEELPVGYPYEVVESAHPVAEAPSPDTLLILRDVPLDLDGRVRELAARVFADCRTTDDKVAAVVRYFHDDYRYSRVTTVPAGEHPVSWFLLRKPAGHCEFFASGAAILLRLADVPTRYVSGFVADERNEFGDYWIARNRDAHAWVEAWDAESGWQVVEATPSDGVPHGQQLSQAGQLYEFLRDQFQRFRILLHQRGLSWLTMHMVRVMQRVDVLVGIGVLLLAVVFWRRRQRLVTTAPIIDPELNRLRGLLASADRTLARQGISRLPYETLYQFAGRLDGLPDNGASTQFSAWYRDYANLRYSTVVNSNAIHDLQARLTGDRRMRFFRRIRG